jgi:hypothetical protein
MEPERFPLAGRTRARAKKRACGAHQVMRILLPIGVKALLDGRLGRDAARECSRAAVLDELARRFRGELDGPAPDA